MILLLLLLSLSVVFVKEKIVLFIVGFGCLWAEDGKGFNFFTLLYFF